MKRWDVLAFGAVSVDELLYLDGHPEPDSKVHVAERRREGGGLAGTALCAAAKLGARAAWAGVLGDDELSRFSIDDLRRYGVDCSQVILEADARPHYSVIIVNRASGARTILAMHDGVREFPTERVTEELIGSCDVLFVDHHGWETGIKAAHMARRLGIPVVADIERLICGVGDLLPLVDHLILGYSFARELTGEEDAPEIARRLGEGRACGVVTHGAKGSWFAAQGQVTHQPAFEVPVVDTTGCGDVFHGAYAACLARGETVAEAVRIASACAALKARQPGGRSGIPDGETVREFLITIPGE